MKIEGKEIFLKGHREKIEKAYEKLASRFPQLVSMIDEKLILQEVDENTTIALKYLYTNMPDSDRWNYSFETFYDYATHGVMLWETYDHVKALPEEYFLNYVLHHRIFEEEIRPCRSLFYDQMKDRLSSLKGKDAVLEVNYWCAKEVTYQSTDDRTLSAAAVYQRGYGRCGEESVFTVNALRSVGIAARQVYAPWWSHCDDNHAWVEVLCDDEWYFLGACEPEPVLNKGWFTHAASRGMMIHSRYFSDFGKEQKAKEIFQEKDGIAGIANQLHRYANETKISVVVCDINKKPVEGATVLFEVLNYSRYVSIAKMETDQEGRVELQTGLGSIHIQGVKGDLSGGIWMDTSKVKEGTVTLDTFSITEEGTWKELDFYAPSDTPKHSSQLSQEQIKEGQRRLEEAIVKRQEKTLTFIHGPRESFLKKDENTRLWREKLLSVLTIKDQTDCVEEVLEEHLQESLRLDRTSYSEETFLKYVMNPRVEDEVLTSYRREILEFFTKEERDSFLEDPRRIWKSIEERVSTGRKEEVTTVVTSPVGCLLSGTGTMRSKKVLFVSIARTLGIPARLHPMDKEMEYLEGDEFCSVIEKREKTSKLYLKNEGKYDWKYDGNWSISKWEEDHYEVLRLSDELWEVDQPVLDLEEGRYRVVTSVRLPNGNIFAYEKEWYLSSGQEKELDLLLRNFDWSDLLVHLSIPEIFLKDENKNQVQIQELAGKKRKVFIWLDEGKEPTEHILNEILELKEDFREFASSLVFIVREKEALLNPTIMKVLEEIEDIQVYYDDFAHNVEALGRRMYVDHEKLPLVVMTDERKHGIYATSGYNVGTGEMLIRLLRM